VELESGPREVECRVVVGEERLVASVPLLHRPGLAGCELRQCLTQRLDDDHAHPRIERIGLDIVADLHRPLGEDRAGVELRIHAVERDPDLLVAVADRPRNRHRAAVHRQERRMSVDPAQGRHRERVGRDLPREAHADDEVGLDRGEERRDQRALRRQQHAEIGRQLTEHAADVEGAVAAVGITDREHRDRLVPRFAHGLVEPERHRQHPGHDDHLPAELRSRLRRRHLR
jgi:hypothetical protein